MTLHTNPTGTTYGNVPVNMSPSPQDASVNPPPRLDDFRHPASFVAALELYFDKDMSRFHGYLSSQAGAEQGVEMFKAAINYSHSFRDYLNIANPTTSKLKSTDYSNIAHMVKSGRNFRDYLAIAKSIKSELKRDTPKIEPCNAPAVLALAAIYLEKDNGAARALDYINDLANNYVFGNRIADFTNSMSQAVAELAHNLDRIRNAENRNKAIGIVNQHLHLLSPQMRRSFLSKVNPEEQLESASMSSVSPDRVPEIGNYGPALPQFVSAMESHFGNNMESLYSYLKGLPRSETSTKTFRCMINGSHMLREYLDIANPITSGQYSNTLKIAPQNMPEALARAATHLTEHSRISRALEKLEKLVSSNALSGSTSNWAFVQSVYEAVCELALNLKCFQRAADRDTAIRIINICRPHLHPDTQNYIHDLLSTEYQSPPPLREDYAGPAQFAAAMEAHFGYNMPRLYEHFKLQTVEAYRDMISNSHMLRDYLHIANPAMPGYNPKTPRIHPDSAPEAVAGAATHINVKKHTATSRALGYLEAQLPRFLGWDVNTLQFKESFCRAVVELSANLNYIAESPYDRSSSKNKNRAWAIINDCFSHLDEPRQRIVQENLSAGSQAAAAGFV